MYFVLFALITVANAAFCGQLGQWHDPAHRFDVCEAEVPLQPYFECIAVHEIGRNQYTLEYSFGVRNCNPCCVTAPSRLVSSHLNLSSVALPATFCPGYYANVTRFNVTYERRLPLGAYAISYQVGNLSATATPVRPDRNSPDTTGPACIDAPLEHVACYNPCRADASNVAVPQHPAALQRRYPPNPVATCGWPHWDHEGSVLLIGAGSGLGLSTYKMLKQLNATVKVAGRYTGQGERSIAAYPAIEPADLLGHNMDVSRDYEVDKAFDYVVDSMPKPLYVMYFPGSAAFGQSNFVKTKTLEDLYRVNVFGVNTVYQRFAATTGHDDGRSRMHVIGSNSMIQHTPTIPLYSASKGAQGKLVEAYINERINRQLAGANDTLCLLSISAPSAMKTDWAYYNWAVAGDRSYLAPAVKTVRDAFSDGTHNNPLVTPAAGTAHQLVQLLSLPSATIDTLKASMTIPYDLGAMGEYTVPAEDALLSVAQLSTIEDETAYIASTYSGAFLPFVSGQNQQAAGQL